MTKIDAAMRMIENPAALEAFTIENLSSQIYTLIEALNEAKYYISSTDRKTKCEKRLMLNMLSAMTAVYEG